jgi:hypothetical protein
MHALKSQRGNILYGRYEFHSLKEILFSSMDWFLLFKLFHEVALITAFTIMSQNNLLASSVWFSRILVETLPEHFHAVL